MKTISTLLFALSVTASCATTPTADRTVVAAMAPAATANTPAPAPARTGGTFAKVDIPGSLAVSPAAKLALRLHATGDQIYICAASPAPASAGTVAYGWTLKAPEATLYDENGTAAVGKHAAGPVWIYKDGSTVVGAKVAQEKAPQADDIPWLLIRAISHQGSGVLANVSYAQRVNTSRGKAPVTGCQASTVGQEARAAYSADYYFYVGGNDQK